MAKTNPFDKFIGITPLKAVIEGLDGYEITYRKLLKGEADVFNKRLVKEYDGDGKPKIDMDEVTKVAYEKIALCLIDPEITVKVLKSMSVDSDDAIIAIGKLLEKEVKEVDDEGNQDD